MCIPGIVARPADAGLRDTEQVPLLQPGGIEAFIRRRLPNRRSALRVLLIVCM